MLHLFQTYLYSSVLSLAAISVFLRMGFLLKLCLMVASVIIHIILYRYMDLFNDPHYDKYVPFTVFFRLP